MQTESFRGTGESAIVTRQRAICGFWRRILAFIIDSLILGSAGLLLGRFFFDFLSRLGPWGILLGFSIAMVYFVPLDSSLGHGQTWGKRLMKIRVVNGRGDHITVSRSFLRYLIIAVPFFLNGAILPPVIASSPVWGFVLGLIVFGGNLLIIYLYVFNRRTRQSLHDLAAGTYVVNKNTPEGHEFQNIWKGHLIVAGVLVVLVLAGMAAMKNIGSKQFFRDLQEVQMKIQGTGKVHASSVFSGKSSTLTFRQGGNAGASGSVSYLSITAVCKDPYEQEEALADEIAGIVLNSYPDIMEKNLMTVVVRRGYDIGISRFWITRNFQYSPHDWADRLNRPL